jgi:hypothetical protein
MSLFIDQRTKVQVINDLVLEKERLSKMVEFAISKGNYISAMVFKKNIAKKEAVIARLKNSEPGFKMTH